MKIKFSFGICLFVLILSLHHQTSKCEDELVIIEELVFETDEDVSSVGPTEESTTEATQPTTGTTSITSEEPASGQPSTTEVVTDRPSASTTGAPGTTTAETESTQETTPTTERPTVATSTSSETAPVTTSTSSETAPVATSTSSETAPVTTSTSSETTPIATSTSSETATDPSVSTTEIVSEPPSTETTPGTSQTPVTGTVPEDPDEPTTELPDQETTPENNFTTPVTQSTTDPQTTASTSTQPPVNAPQPIPPVFEDVEVEVVSTVLFTDPQYIYNSSLENPDHPFYQQMQTETIDKMDGFFASAPDSGYIETIVTGFSNGSIIADTIVVMEDALEKDPEGVFPVCDIFSSLPDDLSFFDGADCQTYMGEQEAANCESETFTGCPDTWRCVYDTTAGAQCQHQCYIAMTADPDFCSAANQYCTVRVDGGTSQAECTCDSLYLNAGGSCIHQNVVIITASVVGGILLIMFIALISVMAVRLNRKPYDYIDPYKPSKGGKRAADLWASVPDDTSQNVSPYADELTGKAAVQGNSSNRNSPRDSDSGRVTSGHENQAFEGDDNLQAWSNIPLNDKQPIEDTKTPIDDDLDKVSDVSALDIDDTYMRSLLSSSAYQEIGNTDFKITRPVFRMGNMKNGTTPRKEDEKSEGEEFVF